VRIALEAGHTTQGPFVFLPATGAWSVSDFQGKDVYLPNGENIGSINDVLISHDGSVNAVVVGVGGFLGIGAKDVAVDLNALAIPPGVSQEAVDAALA